MVKNLKSLRMRSKVSQQALANALGVSQQSINKYENHKVEPDIDALISMADFFGVSLDYLVGRTDGDNNETELNSNPILSKYKALSKKERDCVDTVIETLYSKK